VEKKSLALGYCGLNCAACPVFIATTKNDDELRRKTAEEWSKLYAEFLGGKPLKPEDMNCEGCRSGNNGYIGCKTCPIRACSREKGFDTCAGCGKYETCVMLNGFFSQHHEQAKENLDRIRKAKAD